MEFRFASVDLKGLSLRAIKKCACKKRGEFAGEYREISPLRLYSNKPYPFLLSLSTFYFRFLKSFLPFMSVTYSEPTSKSFQASSSLDRNKIYGAMKHTYHSLSCSRYGAR